jgi:hypothetical protein
MGGGGDSRADAAAAASERVILLLESGVSIGSRRGASLCKEDDAREDGDWEGDVTVLIKERQQYNGNMTVVSSGGEAFAPLAVAFV